MGISLELCASVMSGRVLLSILKLTITVIGLLALPAQAETIFTYRKPESDSDHRYDYDNAVLKLALEKTRKEYGNFRFQASPPMNYSRAIEDSRNKVYPNFFIKLSYEDRFAEMGLTYARFPIDLGIVGYRVCFVRSALKAQLEKTTNLTELKRYTHGQGIGWSDVQVLRHNGFTVYEVSNYESLFKMVAAGRFDLFCRGANELFDEYRLHSNITQLDYDSSFAIVYPLPRFFFTNTTNKKAIERVTKGLQAAYLDGSLQQLWREEYQRSIDFAGLKKRRIFRIENPQLSKINFNYQKYNFDPLKD